MRRSIIVVIIVIAAVLAGFYLKAQWVKYGTPVRTLKTIISSGSRKEAMQCYSRKSRAMMKKSSRGSVSDYFVFSTLTGRNDIEIIAEEIMGPEALIRVRMGEGPSYDLRFVREGFWWKFDISDKLSMALKGVGSAL